MIALIASFFSLCVGPLVYQTFGPLRRTDKIASGIVLVVVTGVVVIDVIPQSYAIIGYSALLLALIGFVGPTLIEKTFRQAANTTHKLTIYLGICGLLVHAFIDGAAIQGDQQNDNNALTLAIILHRLPIGLTIWWMLKPLLGEKHALMILLLMGLYTFTGYAFNQQLIDYQDSTFFSMLRAIIAGSLLHVVVHKPHADGCMHTDKDHQDHAQSDDHHQHHADEKQSQQQLDSKISRAKLSIKSLIFRWETLGLLIGFVLLFVTQYNHH